MAMAGVKVDLLADTPVGGAEAPGSKGGLSINVRDPTWPRPLAGPPAASRSGPLCMTKCCGRARRMNDEPLSR